MDDRLQLSPSAFSETEGVEYAPSQDGEVIIQLSEKIRQQAKRLAGLERYKQICEERIKELDPGHQTPVSVDHLGLRPKDSAPQQLHLAHQKILRLEHQLAQLNVQYPESGVANGRTSEQNAGLYYKLQETIKDKATLEESLRAEMLQSEEQRSYIEVLKQALEAKMEDLGIPSMSHDAFTHFLNSTSEIEGSRKETGRLQSALMDSEAQLKRVSEKLARKIEDDAFLGQENERLKTENLKVSQEIEMQNDELVRILAEKDALLDYVDEHDRETTELKKELELLRRDHKALLEGHSSMQGQLEDMRTHLNETERKIETSRTQNEKLEGEIEETSKALNDTETELVVCRSRLEEQAGMIETLREQALRLQAQLKTTDAQYSLSQRTLQETEFRLTSTSKQLADRALQLQHEKEQKLDLQDALQTAQQHLQSYQERVYTLEDDLASSVGELQSSRGLYEETVKASTDRLEREKSQVSDLVQRLADKDRQASELQGAVTEYTEAKQDLEGKLDYARQEIGSLSSRCLDKDQELGRAQLRYADVVDRLKATQEQLEQTQGRLQGLEAQFRSSQSALRQAEDEKLMQLGRINELKRLLDASREVNEEQGRRLESCSEENSATRRSLNDREQEAAGLADYSQRLQEQVGELEVSERGLQQQVNRAEAELHKTRAQHEDLEAAVSQGLTALIGKSRSQYAKELVRKWEGRPQGSEGLLEWLRSSQSICSSSILQAEQLETELQMAFDRVNTVNSHLEELQTTERMQRERERELRSQIDTLIYQKDHSETGRSALEREVSALTQEVQQLNREINIAAEEHTRLRSQVSSSQTEACKWRLAVESHGADLRSVEERLTLTLREKKSLELLLSRLQGALPSSELKRVCIDLLASHNDLDLAERERLRIEGHLKQLEGLRTGEDAARDTSNLNTSYVRCRDQISQHTRRVAALEKELDVTEAAERKKYLGLLETEKRYEALKAEVESRQDRSPRRPYAYQRPH
jgi:chromosome segregation ATPase